MAETWFVLVNSTNEVLNAPLLFRGEEGIYKATEKKDPSYRCSDRAPLGRSKVEVIKTHHRRKDHRQTFRAPQTRMHHGGSGPLRADPG